MGNEGGKCGSMWYSMCMYVNVCECVYVSDRRGQDRMR